MSYSKLFNERSTVIDVLSSDDERPERSVADKEKLKHLQLSMSGNAEAVGLQNLNNAPAEARTGSHKEKDKKDRAFNDLLRRLNEQRIWLLQMMEDIQEHIEQLTRSIEQCSRIIEALKDVKEGKSALDDDGYPENDLARDAIKEWERKTGKKWTAPEGMQVLDLIILEQENKRDGLTGDREVEQQKWDELNDQYQAVDDAIYELEQDGYTSSTDKDEWTSWLDKQESERNAIYTTNNTLQAANKATNVNDPLNSMPGIS